MKVPPVPEPFIPPSPDFQATVLRELTAIKDLATVSNPFPADPPRLHRLTRLIPILGAKL